MDKIIEMREQMAQLATEARAELDKITDKTEASEAKELESRFDGIMERHDNIAEQVKREERMAQAEAEAREARRPGAAEEQEAAAEARSKTPEYAEVFEKQLRQGVHALDAEERTVLMSGRAESRAQSSTTDAAGGYTVPEGFSGEIDRAMAAWGPMWDASIVRELVTSSGNPLPWPTVDDTANTGRLKAENAAVNDDGGDDVVFGEKVLNAFIYDTGMVRIPIELLQDSAFAIEPLMNDLYGERLGRLANEILTIGTGTNQPQGIVGASTEGTTAAAGSLDSDSLIDLFHSVDPAYRQSPFCRWMFNDSTLSAIRKLKDGQGNYLWQMGDVRIGEPDTFLGKPYSVNQAMANIGASARSILFGDLNRYVVRKVRGFEVMTLRERYAENFQVGMVGFKRFDGELINTGAVKHLAHDAT